MIYEFNGYVPVIDPSSYIHKEATIIGNVIIGKDVYVGLEHQLEVIGVRLQLKMDVIFKITALFISFLEKMLFLKKMHIGHGAIIHGSHIGKNSPIGMNSVIMDDTIIGEECIVGALCFVKGEMKIPKRKIVVGNPAQIKGEVTDDMIKWKKRELNFIKIFKRIKN